MDVSVCVNTVVYETWMRWEAKFEALFFQDEGASMKLDVTIGSWGAVFRS